MMIAFFTALNKLHRGVFICGGFALFMLLGALLLMIPWAQTGRQSVSFVDALFLSVSAVSVTGMSMFDLRNDFTIFGQMVILVLMQVGGLGIMTMMAWFSISTGRKIRLQERLLIRDSFNLQTPSGMVMLVRKIIFMTLIVEFTAGTLLAGYFYPSYGINGIYMGYWHSVSAFTNCGMDIMGADVGFSEMAVDPFVSTVIAVTMFLGGVGFMVIDDVWHHHRWGELSVNTRLILCLEIVLILLGVLVFLALEGSNPETLGNLSMRKMAKCTFYVHFCQNVRIRCVRYPFHDECYYFNGNAVYVHWRSPGFHRRRGSYDNGRASSAFSVFLDQREEQGSNIS